MRIIPISLALALAASHAQKADAPFWRWPVPLDRAVSSNFCEYRDGRFHAGIDVRTFGSEGVPCIAISDGWISRMRAGSRGYGKALHLTLPDSTQIVYGHLSEFAPVLEETLYAAQMKDTTFSVDIRFPPDRFRVAAGDTIAYSGMTGTTAPHLHLEVRDAQERPVDPFGTALAIPDGLKPSITRIAFVPLARASRVNGRCLPWGEAVHRTGEGRYVIEDTLRITGRVGVAATVNDRVNTESGRLAPHALEVEADGALRARIVMNRFSFDHQVEVDHLYDAGLLRAHEVLLFQIWNTGASPFDTTWVEGGALPVDTTQVHHGRVIASDAAGNSAEVDFVFMCGAFAARAHEKADARRDLTVELDGAFFQDGFAAIPTNAATRADADAPADVIFLDARHLGTAVRPLAAYADRDTAALWVAGLPRREDRDVRFPAHGIRLGIPAAALASDAVVYARGADAFARNIDGIERLTRPVRVGPVGWVLQAPMLVHIDMPHPGEHESMYRFDDYRRSWTFMPSIADSTGWSAKSDRPGVFAVFRDVAEPDIGKPSLARTRSWATGAPRRELRIPIGDAGSGFDEPRCVVRVGGRRMIFRWDFVGKKLIVPLHDASILGKQSVSVVAFDRSGNRSSRSATVDTGAP
ncbi:MAG TPA: M23 family metallopeptidase [Candidatus Krumholzibacteria bacterium]|nr:M23 family metallopeptidase [Candidatus Krumholzibacteria bacterium]